jgi:hypothetical protein
MNAIATSGEARRSPALIAANGSLWGTVNGLEEAGHPSAGRLLGDGLRAEPDFDELLLKIAEDGWVKGD